ncbi:MAG: glycogen synthase [Bacilli bacterium]|nr:glycogen synthase [Bacilli bacterium]
MKIAMIASESNPLAKTGGLADVVYSLAKEYAALKHEACIIMPYYRRIKDHGIKTKFLTSYPLSMAWRQFEVRIYTISFHEVKFYLIDSPYYFDRNDFYGYGDDGERFAFFALAAVELFRHIDFKPDVLHLHDWQAAIIPTLIKEQRFNDPIYQNLKTVLTIHNPAFKGYLDRYFLGDFFSLSDDLYFSGRVRFEDQVSTLKAGIVDSDIITTVSPTHREELLHPGLSQNLDGILELRKDDFYGILNGIDYDEWDSLHDPYIAKKFDKKNLEEAKHINQEALLKRFNIKWYGGPVYGLVSRLSWQKGIDILLPTLRRALLKGASAIILGSGEYDLEQKFEELRREFPDTLGIYIGYNNEISHMIYAGCDYFLMPSLFEPCGISQMIAQKYGTLPIVRYTGGLKDTVEGYDETNLEKADGIGFNDYDEGGLDYAFEISRRLFCDQKKYYQVAHQAMEKDHSWRTSAENYLSLYKK